MYIENIYLGTKNRVESLNLNNPDGDFWCAIEGGCFVGSSGQIETVARAYITNKIGIIGEGATAGCLVPKEIASLINQGWELGPAEDHIPVPLLRDELYTHAIICALIPFINQTL